MSSDALEKTQRWVSQVIVGLGLCPFAKPVIDAGKLAIEISDATTDNALLADLDKALLALDDTGPDTTLLVVPEMLGDFIDFNAFLDIADALLEARGLIGTVQIATFHPNYLFADEDPTAVSHFTNRAPYPILHLLREADVNDAVASFKDIDAVPQRNIAKLESLSTEQFAKLFG